MSKQNFPEKAAEDIFPQKNDFRSPVSKFPLDRFPILDLDDIHANMELFFNNFYSDMESLFKSQGSSLIRSVSKSEGFAPATRSYRDGDSTVVEMEVPGLDREDLKINVHDKCITVEGEKKESHSVEEDKIISSSVRYGSFYREIPTENVDVKGIASSLENGILKIVLPTKKEKESPPRQIEIR